MAGTFLTTTRFALRRLVGTSKVSDVDEGFQRLAEDVDNTMVGLVVDTFAKRPAAGEPNRLFRASDTGVYYLDNGTVWQTLGIVVFGQVADPTTVSNSSGDFTVEKVATGEYRIVFTTVRAAASHYSVVVSPWNEGVSEPWIAQVKSEGATNSFLVRLTKWNGSNSWLAANGTFTFIAVGGGA